MKDIYIHIGTHKTGTTTIQNTLSANIKTSEAQGWKYIKSPDCTKYFMTSKKYDPILVKKFKREIDTAVKKEKSTKKFILSNEGLSGDPLSGYLNSNIVSSMLQEATKHYNVKIIIYLRNQDDFLESMYTQTIHEGGTLDFNTFLSYFDHPDSLNYDKFVRHFELSFGLKNLFVRSYNNASENGLLADFSNIIESKLLSSSTSSIIKNNISYSRNALEIARICNLQLNQKQKRQLRKTLQKIMYKEKSESFSFFTSAARITFMEKFECSNNEVTNRYFEGNLESLFPEKTRNPLPSTSEVSCKQVSILLTELFKRNDEKKVSKTILKQYKAVLSSIKLLYAYFFKNNKKVNN